ncbi:MAG: hypothetical protein QGG05_02910 [Candidatus Latescibacteria bacterium]|nr:hypothetical protein [Candidatus Latescibacterota bacterium]
MLYGIQDFYHRVGFATCFADHGFSVDTRYAEAVPSRLVIRCGDEAATPLRRRQKLSVSTTAHGRGLQVADTGLIMQLGHAGGAAAMRGSARDRQLS